MKIVINRCYGEFGLSKQACEELGIPWDDYGHEFIEDRTNPEIIAVVEKLGKNASGWCSELRVVEIPDGVEWTIEEYDGLEWIAESHRTWY